MTSGEDLRAQLTRLDYASLFRGPEAGVRIERLWQEPDAPERLQLLSLDPEVDWKVRLLATEIIFHRQMFLIRPEHYARLAPVYVNAFLENATGFMCDWGFLNDMKDPGILGSRLVQFGRSADPLLKPLLENQQEVAYVYPPEFPSEARFGLRIKDFAALYLSNINSIDAKFTDDSDQRDREIERLKGLLS